MLAVLEAARGCSIAEIARRANASQLLGINGLLNDLLEEIDV
jgi:hypothetical protein